MCVSVDCISLSPVESNHLHWSGLQNQTLEHLSCSGPNAILEPNRCFGEMIRAALSPQFSEYTYNINQPIVSCSKAI